MPGQTASRHDRIVRLPAAAAATAAATTGEASRKAAPARRRRHARVQRAGRDRAEVVDHRSRAATRRGRPGPSTTIGAERLRVEPFEDLRPLLRAAEHDRVRQVLREDVVLLGEARTERLRRPRRTSGGTRGHARVRRCPCRCGTGMQCHHEQHEAGRRPASGTRPKVSAAMRSNTMSPTPATTRPHAECRPRSPASVGSSGTSLA